MMVICFMATSQVLSSLEGLSAAVTGGSSGLGFATVERLSIKGCRVAIIDVNEPKLIPKNCYYIYADITEEQFVQNAVNVIEEKAGKLDILINCVTTLYIRSIYDQKTDTPHPLTDFEDIIKVNTTGAFNMIRLCCPLFNKNKPNGNNQRGVIINTASIAAFEGPQSCTAYSASKAGIVGMTLPLARDLSSMGVRVVAIAPGSFDTPLVKHFPQNSIDSVIKQIPFPKRLGHPDEFAHLVQCIIENPMLNGEVIRIDGGRRLGS